MADLTERYPDAPRPLLDLSTGINPWSYPVHPSDFDALRSLPQQQAERDAQQALSAYLGIPASAAMALTPGSQIALSLLPHCLQAGEAGIFEPTYNEHRPAWQRAGHTTVSLSAGEEVGPNLRYLVLVNPNNPDGVTMPRHRLLDLSDAVRRRGGWLVVDEAFCDLDPAVSVAGDAADGRLIVLRSFGKFFGLGGIRFGAAIGPATVIDTLREMIGPWAVSAPALAVAARAYRDTDWIDTTRRELAAARQRLDNLFERAGFSPVGGTDLFRLISHADAAGMAGKLAEKGI